jgi:putative transposase
VTFFDFPEPMRTAIRTTNAIESVNSVIREFARNREFDPDAELVLTGVFVAVREAEKRWAIPLPHWREMLNHFATHFEDRMPTMRS